MNDKPSSRLERVTKHTGDPKDTVITIIVAAIILTVALAWRDTIQTAFDKFFPHDEDGIVLANLIYAVVVTVVCIGLFYLIAKATRHD